VRWGTLQQTPTTDPSVDEHDDLASLPTTGVTVQICGDAHVRNLGAFASPTGAVVFDINDFDETMPGPWEWDVKRLAASIVLSGREAAHSDGASKEAVESFVAEYRKSVNYCSELTVLEIARYTVHRHPEARPLAALLAMASVLRRSTLWRTSPRTVGVLGVSRRKSRF
jgi:uncharacterized protein (DUF2252 family)